MIDRNEVKEMVRKMKDIDGYDKGDCVSRKAVLAILDMAPDKRDPAYQDDLK